MKLLLTSTGVTNKSIQKALEDLIGKPISESSVAFIPTAAHGVPGDKNWLVQELNVARDLGWKTFDLLELTAVTPEELRERLEAVDVIHMNGGNSYFLMNRIIGSGLEKILPELLKTKVYVSSSAGGVITSKYYPGNLAEAYDETPRVEQGTVDHGLGLVDFVVKAHLNAAYFSHRTLEWYDKVTKDIAAPVYAIDDDTALKVVDGKVEVVTEGIWKLYNQN